MQTKRSARSATIFSRVSAAPPPLIMQPARIDLVGAVDADRQRLDVAGVEHRDAVRDQPRRARRAARDRAGDAAADAGQRVDEEVDGRSRADADHRAGRHVGERRLGDQALEFVLRHAAL